MPGSVACGTHCISQGEAVNPSLNSPPPLRTWWTRSRYLLPPGKQGVPASPQTLGNTRPQELYFLFPQFSWVPEARKYIYTYIMLIASGNTVEALIVLSVFVDPLQCDAKHFIFFFSKLMWVKYLGFFFLIYDLLLVFEHFPVGWKYSHC